MVSGNFEQVGLEALIIGAAQYLQDAASINAATSQLVNGVQQRVPAATRDAAGGMNVLTAGMQAATGATGQLVGGFSAMLGPFSGLAREGAQVSGEMTAIATESSSLTGVFVGLAGVAAAVAGTFGGLALAGAQWADEMMRITSITGLAQDEAEKYSIALELVGGSGQALIRTTFMLERQLQSASYQIAQGEEPTGRVARAMKELGIEFAESNGEVRDMGDLIPELLTKLGTMEDATQRNAIASALFGRYGIDVTRMLANWGTVMPAAEEIMAKFNGTEADASELSLEFHRNLTELSHAFESLGVRVLPQFNEIAARVTKAIGDWVVTHGEDFVRNLGVVIEVTVFAVERFASAIASIPPWLLRASIEAAAAGFAFKVMWGAATGAAGGIGDLWESLNKIATGANIVSGIAAMSEAVTVLKVAVTGAAAASYAFFLTPPGWVALAAGAAIAATAYYVWSEHAKEAAKQEAFLASVDEELADAIKQNSSEIIAAKINELNAQLAVAQAELAVEEQRQGFLNSNAVTARSIELRQEIDTLLKALGKLGPQYREAKEAQDALAASTTLLTPEISGAKTVFDYMGVSVAKTGSDLKSLTADMLVAQLIAEDIKNFRGATNENFFDFFPADVFQRQLQSLAPYLKIATDFGKNSAQAAEDVAHAAGIVTDADKAMAAEAQRTAEERERAAKQMVDSARSAAAAIQQAQIGQLDILGNLVIDALRAQYAEQLKVTEDGLVAQRSVIDQVYAERIDAARRASKAEIDAIDASTAAVVAGLNAQINALRDAASAEDREAIVRKIALTYDAKEHAAAEKELRDFDRRVQENALRSQIASVEAQARIRKDDIEDALEGRLDAIGKEQKAANDTLDRAGKAARETYQRQTFDFALQAEARILLMNAEQQRYVTDLITKYAPQWATAGKSMGDQLVSGISKAVDPYLKNLFAMIPYGGIVAGSGGALPQGTPSWVNALSGTPASNHDIGLGRGPAPYPMSTTLNTGEVVLTIEQQRQIWGQPFTPSTSGYSIPALATTSAGTSVTSGPVFNRGAFEGLLAGAALMGEPRDNANAIVAAFERLLGQQLGRGAFLAGSGR